MATFGERFKMLRMKKGLNQEELIDDFNKKYNYGFTKSAVSQYENDKRIPEIGALGDFAEYFDVSIDYLLGRTDIPKAHVVIKEEMPEELKKMGVEKIVHSMEEKKISADKILKIIDMIEDIEKGSH